MAKTYNVYASNSQEGSYTKIAEGITESTINIQSPDPVAGGEKFVKVAEVNDAGEGFLSKPVKLTFIGEVPKPEILKYFYKGFLVRYKNAAYATSMSLQASVNGGEFKTVDSSNVVESFAIVDNIAGSCSLKTVCKAENSLRNGNASESLIPQDFILASASKTGHILRSTDAGTNWNEITVPEMLGYPILLSRFYNNICFCSQFAGLGGGNLFRSADGGLSWAKMVVGSNIFASITYLKNQVFLSSVGTSSTPQAFLERSVDGGVSWSADKQTPCLAVFALNDSVVLLGTKNGILRSTDGGLTFNPTSLNSGEYSLFTFAGNNSIVAAGSNIVRSTDGGLTWEVVSYLNTALNTFTPSVYLGNDISLIFIGGNIMRSIDAGKTWNNTHGFVNSVFTSFANLGGGIVLFGGGAGSNASVMLRSLNYGAKWDIFRPGMCLGLC